MSGARTNRRLAAILAADVVGYTRMMAADEAATLATLKAHRETVFDPAVAEHRGRLVKLIGDGALVEFGSVVDAVNCALAVQRAADTRISLRIGINLGDVIVDGDDIYGDGVNVAARLEPLADPGGICISAIVNESVVSRIDAAFTDAGEVQVKNIDRPIRIWKWSPDGVAAPPKPPAAPDMPSIAILPFANMSGDHEQEYFSDGITEDIITDLSKTPGLLVIARNSSFAYKGRQIDLRTVGRELRVRSLLEGSIRRVGNRVRVTAQLIDTETGGHLWADRYDRDLTDIFAVQDEVTREIVSALKVRLGPADAPPLTGTGGTTNVAAQDLYFRAAAVLAGPHQSREVFERARDLLLSAIAADPDFARPYASLSTAYVNDYVNRWTENYRASMDEALRYAELAVAKGPNDALSHAAYSLVMQLRKDFVRGKAAVEKALALNPNHPMALTIHAMSHVSEGDAAAAIPEIERAMRLDPAWAQGYLHHLGTTYLLSDRFETAAALYRERIMMVPNTDMSRAFLASALGHLGDNDEARKVWAELKAVNPHYSLDEHLDRMPFPPPYVAKVKAGLAKAGLPG